MLLPYNNSPMEVTLPEAGKTPNTPLQGLDLATAVDGDNGEVCHDSMPSQGVHMSPLLIHLQEVDTRPSPHKKIAWTRLGWCIFVYVNANTHMRMYAYFTHSEGGRPQLH